MSDFLRNEIMRFLRDCRGRDKAIPRSELLCHLRRHRPYLSDREMRAIYSSLPIASSPEGLFIPKSSQEVLDFSAYIEKAHGPIWAARRREIIYSYYPELRPLAQVQKELF